MKKPTRALIVIDVQNEYFTGNLQIQYPPKENSLPQIIKAIKTAKEEGILVVIVKNIAPESSPLFAKGSVGAELHPDIAALDADLYIEKSMPNAFTGTDLGEWIQYNNIDTITIAGYMTQNCDDSTVKHAVHIGLKVEFLSDATGTVPLSNEAGFASAEEIHRVFTIVMQSRFAAVLSTDDWIHAVLHHEIPAGDNIYSSFQRALSHR